jgi:hypothetical protein
MIPAATLIFAGISAFGCSNHDVVQSSSAAPTPTAAVTTVTTTTAPAAPAVVTQTPTPIPTAVPTSAPTPVPAASVGVVPPVRPAADPDTPVNVITDTVSPSWDDIKNLPYAQHVQFSAGLAKIEERLDRQIGALNAKRSSMETDTKDWDFNMKEVNDARSFLTFLNGEVANAGADIWQQEKDKVEGALKRTQEACEKVKSSTTS